MSTSTFWPPSSPTLRWRAGTGPDNHPGGGPRSREQSRRLHRAERRAVARARLWLVAVARPRVAASSSPGSASPAPRSRASRWSSWAGASRSPSRGAGTRPRRRSPPSATPSSEVWPRAGRQLHLDREPRLAAGDGKGGVRARPADRARRPSPPPLRRPRRRVVAALRTTLRSALTAPSGITCGGFAALHACAGANTAPARNSWRSRRRGRPRKARSRRRSPGR